MRPRACVLTYHRIGSPQVDLFGQAVSASNFTAHLHVLARDYHVDSLDGLVTALRERRVREGTVAVTFDDGYADTLTEAAPIAAAANVPLHVFVAAEPVLDDRPFWWDELAALTGFRIDEFRAHHGRLKQMSADERRRALDAMENGDVTATDLGRPLTVDELRDLAATPQVAIGAHTLTHPMLAARPPDEQLAEMLGARSVLEDAVGAPVDLLSYPFGKTADIGPGTPAIAERAGYRAAFTSTGHAVTHGSAQYTIPRLTVHDWSEDEFHARLRTFFGH